MHHPSSLLQRATHVSVKLAELIRTIDDRFETYDFAGESVSVPRVRSADADGFIRFMAKRYRRVRGVRRAGAGSAMIRPESSYWSHQTRFSPVSFHLDGLQCLFRASMYNLQWALLSGLTMYRIQA